MGRKRGKNGNGRKEEEFSQGDFSPSRPREPTANNANEDIRKLAEIDKTRVWDESGENKNMSTQREKTSCDSEDFPFGRDGGEGGAREGNWIRRSSWTHSTTQGDLEEEEKQMSRRVFIATHCALCLNFKPLAQGGANLCGGCRLLSYCNKHHQREDWKNHKSFCQTAQKLLKKHQRTSLYQHAQHLPHNQWLQVRYDEMGRFGVELGRELEAFEREILLFPRVCWECRSSSCVEICTNCRLVSFCSTHLDKLKGHDWCGELRLWTDLVCWERENGLLRPQLRCQDMRERTSLPDSILGFLPLPPPRFGSCGADVWRAGVSDLLTVPLSLLWAIKNFAPQLLCLERLTIHIVGAEIAFEGECGRGWEFGFLHLLEREMKLKTLDVKLIGPEIFSPPRPVFLCSSCHQNGLKVSVTSEGGMTYDEYMGKSPSPEVDLIAAFNCGLYRLTGWNGKDTWGTTIPYLGRGQVLVTTAYTDSESRQDIQRLTSTRRFELCGGGGENPFRSLRPQRTLIDEENQPLMYKNQFIAVFNPTQ